MTTNPPPEPHYADGDGEDDGFDGLIGMQRYHFVRIPELSKKIKGATPFFFLDMENGDIFNINIDSLGVIRNQNIEECFGKKWKGEVVKLAPKEEKGDGTD